MIKKFLTMYELLCMIQHGTQPDTIYIKNENGTDTEAHWVYIAKEYLTKDGNSLWFKLRKETIFLSRSFYYYIPPTSASLMYASAFSSITSHRPRCW